MVENEAPDQGPSGMIKIGGKALALRYILTLFALMMAVVFLAVVGQWALSALMAFFFVLMLVLFAMSLRKGAR